MATTIITILAALETRFEAISGLSDVQVSVGNPYSERLREDLVIIGDVDETEAFAGLGADAREETYEIDILVSVVRPGRLTHLVMLQRAFVISDLIEDSIIAWRTESPVFDGICGWMGINGKSTGHALMPDGKEREASVILRLGVRARI